VSSMEPAAAAKTALLNVRVFDGHRLRPPGTVVIEGDWIGTDASGAEVIDGAGGVLLPGLIDAHVHVRDQDTLRRLCGFGVTTVLDMASGPPGWTRCARLPG
jgi:dihydroorotase-like cyclic amidohydrolase